MNFNDNDFASYIDSLDSLGTIVPKGNLLAQSFLTAKQQRDSFVRWLFRMMDDPTTKDPDFFSNLISDMQNSSDESYAPVRQGVTAPMALHRWGARYSMEDAFLEYGIVDDASTWEMEGDNFCEGYTHLLDATEDYDLCKVDIRKFADKSLAKEFCAKLRKAFASGDHTNEIVGTLVSASDPEPFQVHVLVADGNWDHRILLAEARDAYVEKMLGYIETANEATLRRIAGKVRTSSRNMQVLQSGRTFDGKSSFSATKVEKKSTSKLNYSKYLCLTVQDNDIQSIKPRMAKSLDYLQPNEPVFSYTVTGGRKCGNGIDYKRFATLMNAIADRAETLGCPGFKRYEIREMESSRVLADGDILDVGAREGEFMAVEVEDVQYTSALSAWEANEGTWKPSAACAARLEAAGPTGFVWRSWDVLVASMEPYRLSLVA